MKKIHYAWLVISEHKDAKLQNKLYIYVRIAICNFYVIDLGQFFFCGKGEKCIYAQEQTSV